MKYLLRNAILHNRLPEVIPAVEYSPAVPAIPATETSSEVPEIPEVSAQPEKYKFSATIFIGVEGAPDGKFIQDENIEFITESTEQSIVRSALQTEAIKFIEQNYPETL